jgi:hypothetical protein
MEEKKETPRTLSQNNALHLGMKLLCDALNDAGYDQRKILKPSIDIPWTPIAVKEQLFKPIMKAMTQKEHTADLDKIGEIDDIWDTLFRHLGQKFHIEYIPFPNLEEGEKEKDGLIKINNY